MTLATTEEVQAIGMKTSIPWEKCTHCGTILSPNGTEMHELTQHGILPNRPLGQGDRVGAKNSGFEYILSKARKPTWCDNQDCQQPIAKKELHGSSRYMGHYCLDCCGREYLIVPGQEELKKAADALCQDNVSQNAIS